jgi:hypothetical protein
VHPAGAIGSSANPSLSSGPLAYADELMFVCRGSNLLGLGTPAAIGALRPMRIFSGNAGSHSFVDQLSDRMRCRSTRRTSSASVDSPSLLIRLA